MQKKQFVETTSQSSVEITLDINRQIALDSSDPMQFFM